MNQGTAKLTDIEVLVLDEADRMLDMGFKPQLNKILERVPKVRQTMLFSATMAGEVAKFAETHLTKPVRVEVTPTGTTAARATQQVFMISQGEKTAALLTLLSEGGDSTLVFTRTKRRADKVAKLARARRPRRVAHPRQPLAEPAPARARRLQVSGKYRVLVATDIAARGIDVAEIGHVVNYDLPNVPEDYVHRIGRTARAGKEGHAISLATPDQGQDVKRIERILRATIPVAEHPDVPKAAFDPNAQPPPRGGRGGGGGGGGRGQGGGGRGHGGGGGGGGRSQGPRRSQGPGEAHPPARAGGGGYGGLRAPGSGSGAAHPPKGGSAPKSGKVGHAFRGRKHF
jgi:ATP-dependent RNA helicase RhlE